MFLKSLHKISHLTHEVYLSGGCVRGFLHGGFLSVGLCPNTALVYSKEDIF